MHPIERLRWVARDGADDPGHRAREAAETLAGFADDPAELVVACRRLVERAPTAGPVWWLCSHILEATDPRAAAREAAERLASDATERHLTGLIPDGATVTVLGWPEQLSVPLRRRGDLTVLVVDSGHVGSMFADRLERADVDVVSLPDSALGAAVRASDAVLLDADAAGPGGIAATAGSLAAAAVARVTGAMVWVAVGEGRVLPGRLWDALVDRLDNGDELEPAAEVVPFDLVTHAVGPDGRHDPSTVAARADCPIPPELLKETR